MMKDIQAILQQMTLEEKVALCTGASTWTTTSIDRLGVPEITVSDGPHGVRREVDSSIHPSGQLPSTSFPTASCTASSWDVKLIYAMGKSIAEEAIALGVDVILGPGANMKRTPLCGRNFEYFSEDPYLAGEMALNYIQGVQDQGVGTSLKHYALNNQENQRFTISADVDERTMREIYLPAFEAAVKQSKPWTVMCSYNKINGTYGSENHLLQVDILKKEWGFEGLVISDWGAVHDRVVSLEGGLDLEMPGPRSRRVQAVVDAVKTGRLALEVLDEAVLRILRIIFKAAKTAKGGHFDIDGHHSLARKIASEGMVLLKNNGILPLKNPERIAVIGRAAREPYFQGGGSSHSTPTKMDIPFDELSALAGKAQLTYCEGYPVDESIQQELIDEAVEAAGSAQVALLYIALPPTKESEGYDRPDLELTAHQATLIKAVTAAQPQTVVILNNGSAVTMGGWIDGPAAILEAWMMGQAGGGAIADILFGKVNPSGKLAETFPQKLVDTPAYINYPGVNGVVHYGEGLFIGYRYYDAREVPVLFPFGYGQSYTTFEYSSPKLSANLFRDVDTLTVSVNVTNTGKVTGKEIVQVYVHDQKSSLPRPPKELKGFAKVELQPGEMKTVRIPLDFRSFAFYHPGYHRWITEDGEFELLIGASANDIRFTQTVGLQSTLQLPSLLNRESTVREWLEDPAGRSVFVAEFRKLKAQMVDIFGGGGSAEESPEMGLESYILDNPLINLLEFREGILDVSPVQWIDRLLTLVDGTPAKQPV